MCDAFPYQKFGPAWGEVREVSASVLTPAEVSAAVPVQEPVYRVVAALDAQSLRAFGAQVPLQPGMALTADVILEERSFAEWLFEPLLALRARGGAVPKRAEGELVSELEPVSQPASAARLKTEPEPIDVLEAHAPPPHPFQPPPGG